MEQTIKALNYVITPTELAAAVNKSMAGVSKSFKDKATISLAGRRVGLPRDAVKDYLSSCGLGYDFKVISHINLRGGVAKSSASCSLFTRAYQYGFKSVLLDLDSQASSSLNFGIIAGEHQKVFIDVFDDPKSVKEALIEIEPGLSLLPSSLDNGLLDSSLSSKPAQQKTAVRNVCDEIKRLGFDLVVIDVSPSLGAGVISAICASDIIVIPVQSDIFSVRGLQLTLEEIKSICSAFGLPIPEIKILFSKYDGREKLSIDTLAEIAQNEDYSKLLLPCFIRTSSEIPKASKERRTVFASQKKSTAREDYDMYTRELLGLNALHEAR